MASASVSAFSTDVKLAILTRADGRCERCGFRIVTGAHFHHRSPRRMGGSDRPDLGLPSNGVLLHPKCHDWIESHRKTAAQLGFLVGLGTPPHTAPIYLWNGWFWLCRYGTAEKIEGVPSLRPEYPETVCQVDHVAHVDPVPPSDGGSASPLDVP